MYAQIFYGLAYDNDESFRPSNGWTIIDGGANVGVFTLRMAQQLRVGAIYAIEPHPGAYSRLQKNLDMNYIASDVKVLPLNFALGNSCREVLFDYSDSSVHAKIAKTSSNPTLREEKVQMITLTKLVEKYSINQIDLLKLDVEGAEYEALKGAEGVLGKVNRVVLEWHSPKLYNSIRKLLINKGFKEVTEAAITYPKCGISYYSQIDKS